MHDHHSNTPPMSERDNLSSSNPWRSRACFCTYRVMSSEGVYIQDPSATVNYDDERGRLEEG